MLTATADGTSSSSSPFIAEECDYLMQQCIAGYAAGNDVFGTSSSAASSSSAAAKTRNGFLAAPSNSSSGFASDSGHAAGAYKTKESLQRDLLGRRYANPGETEACWRSIAARRWLVIGSNANLISNITRERTGGAAPGEDDANMLMVGDLFTRLSLRHNIVPVFRVMAHSSFAISSSTSSTSGGPPIHTTTDRDGSWSTFAPPRSLYYGTLRKAMTANQLGGGGGIFQLISNPEVLVQTSKRLLMDAFWALHYCHSHGTVHGRVSADTIHVFGSQFWSSPVVDGVRPAKMDLLLQARIREQAVIDCIASSPAEHLEGFLGDFELSFVGKHTRETPTTTPSSAPASSNIATAGDGDSKTPPPSQLPVTAHSAALSSALACGAEELMALSKAPSASLVEQVNGVAELQTCDAGRFLKRFFQHQQEQQSGGESASTNGGAPTAPIVDASGHSTTSNSLSASQVLQSSLSSAQGHQPPSRSSSLRRNRTSSVGPPLTRELLFRQGTELDLYCAGKLIKEVFELSPLTKNSFNNVLRTNAANVYQSHCGDLVQQLLTGLDTGRRPSALQVLGHPWFGLRERQVLLEHRLRCIVMGRGGGDGYLPWEVCFAIGEFVVGVLRPDSYRKLLWEEHLSR